ncbi:MAG: hypothetical protein WDN26_05140 [Chitinophagaceae bacterium]
MQVAHQYDFTIGLFDRFSSLFSAQLYCQTYIGLREIVNYEKQDYNAGAQNWDIRQDAQGRIYFANNEGLLCFDGIYWNYTPCPTGLLSAPSPLVRTTAFI